MLKRLYLYYHERFPFVLRLLLGLIVFCEIYFIVLLNRGVMERKPYIEFYVNQNLKGIKGWMEKYW